MLRYTMVGIPTLDLWIKEIESQLGDLPSNINDAIMLFCDKEITFEELLSYFPKEQQPYLKMTYSKYANFYEKTNSKSNERNSRIFL